MGRSRRPPPPQPPPATNTTNRTPPTSSGLAQRFRQSSHSPSPSSPQSPLLSSLSHSSSPSPTMSSRKRKRHTTTLTATSTTPASDFRTSLPLAQPLEPPPDLKSRRHQQHIRRRTPHQSIASAWLRGRFLCNLPENAKSYAAKWRMAVYAALWVGLIAMSTTFSPPVGASESAEKEFREHQHNTSGGTSTDQSVVAWINGTATNGTYMECSMNYPDEVRLNFNILLYLQEIYICVKQ